MTDSTKVKSQLRTKVKGAKVRKLAKKQVSGLNIADGHYCVSLRVAHWHLLAEHRMYITAA